MAGICEGRVVIVTGAGRGIGAEHALEFARQGAKVVVNDIGGALDGTGTDVTPAQEIVDRIRAAGGEAVTSYEDVTDWDAAARLVRTAVDTFGDLHTLVNNAGAVRDRMFVNMSADEWDAAIRINLRGHFCPARHAAAYWRDRAKAAIAALTLVQAAELARYGITANAIAPSARTRMTEAVFADLMAAVEAGFDAMAPENIAPLVVWLGSNESADVSGRVFEVEGGKLSVADGWQHGTPVDRGARWAPVDVGPAIRQLLRQAPHPAPVYGAV